jgi:hypothetical protein
MHALKERRANPRTRPRDDYQQLLNFSASLYGDVREAIVKVGISMLPLEFSAQRNEKVPCEKFESAYRWVFALKKEVDAVLLPMVRNRAPQSNSYFKAAAAFASGDRVSEDLATEERLDAAIDRALRRLYQLKMAREPHAHKQPKLIDGNSSKQLEHPDVVARRANE